MIWLLLILQLATAAGLIILYLRQRESAKSAYLSEEEAQAETFLTSTVERLLHDLQLSAKRATERLTEQTTSLESLLHKADERIARLPQAMARAGTDSDAASAPPSDGQVDQDPPWIGEVVALANDGLAPLQIAKQVGRGEREVRLVLTRVAEDQSS